jgi:hypothetical protein
MNKKILFTFYWAIVGLYIGFSDPSFHKNEGREPQSVNAKDSMEMMAMGGGF